MPANPQISLPFPTQIASGQALAANPVQSDLQHVASQFNTHTHDAVDVTNPGAAFVPVGGVIMWPGATSFLANFWYADGATFIVSSWPALASACGTWHGGNASIGRIPDLQGRMPVSWTRTGGLAAVSTLGGNDGIAVASRGPSHHHTLSFTTSNSPNESAQLAIGQAILSSVKNTSGGAPLDTPAYYVMNFLIRAL